MCVCVIHNGLSVACNSLSTQLCLSLISHFAPALPKVAVMATTPPRDRTTDSLLHPGRGHTPSHGINEDDDSVEDDRKGLMNVSVKHAGDRVWTVATFTLIACLGSVVIGMSLGYSTNTLAELSEDSSVYVVSNSSIEASLFGVRALLCHLAVKIYSILALKICLWFCDKYIICVCYVQAFGPLGALFGGPVAWPLSEKFGRKPAMLLSTIPGLVGWVAMSVSTLLPTRDGFLAFLYSGRLLSGFAAGWSIFCISVSSVV